MDNKFGIYTKEFISKLPYWFSIRKNNKNSIGASFLNCFGLELDNIESFINYCFDQCYIGTADIKQKDIIYRVELPDSFNDNNIVSVKTSIHELVRVNNLDDFLQRNDNYINDNIPYNPNVYFYDKVRNILYINYPYNIFINDEEYKTTPHHVWNVFDEFGMLLCCPRLFAETNLKYKDRILDVFRYPANATKKGLLNGISRELGLRKRVFWKNCGNDITINDTMILVDSIDVDNIPVTKDKMYIDNQNNIVLRGSSNKEGKSGIISYIRGLQIHELNDTKDIEFINECYLSDGRLTPLMKYYIDRINSISPIDWGRFKWDECYWDVSDENSSGLAFIPSLFDSKIENL